jgi:hypothetical protein
MRQYAGKLPFDPKRLRLERFNVEWAYHATYTFFGLKGAIAERWAHGPIFNAVAEVGTNQLNLTPNSEEEDYERLVAVAGLRASAVVGEGRRRAGQAQELWRRWLEDVHEALDPVRSVRAAADVIGLYPIRDEWKATQKIKLRYSQPDALESLAGVPNFHTAAEIFDTDGRRNRTIVMGVLGPPHRGQYFTFERPQRDDRWWLAARVLYSLIDEEGIADPLVALDEAVLTVTSDWKRISESVFPGLVD